MSLHNCQISRATNGNRDVWQHLETNWTDFFWLTGETPDTLSKLVAKIKELYDTIYHQRRRSIVNFRNQVSFFNL